MAIDDRIQQALAYADTTKHIAFGHHVTGQAGALFAQSFPGKRAILVADTNTWNACGPDVQASFEAAGISMDNPYIFPGSPTLYASYENVDILRGILRATDAICCSIAAGTLNDLAKLASYELERPYMNVCTAASVDGFAAFGASIAKDGFKITRTCDAPVALVADVDVMAQAPQRLTATGYGDLIEKIPAGADWILSEELGIEAIDTRVWELVQGPLRQALANPDAIASGDPDALVGLAEGNLMSGLAMQAYQSSRPASGAGHQFSHTWEMEGHGLDEEPPLSHGFKVGIGTIASCALWEYALSLDLTTIDIDALVATAPTRAQVEEQVRALHIPAIQDAAVSQTMDKFVDGEALRERLERIVARWPQIVERCQAQLISPEEVMAALHAVGAPSHPAMIGIDLARLKQTYFQAYSIRSRYTILDLLNNVQYLGNAVDALFGPDGFWGRHLDPLAS
ncbi:sn-glycerol-1-phosphate dehydrogenase [Stomatohabitans albus]|uniref:sn-glycerol-1-phosphate dehydrogenase n=1 Tax=Stomatohabitans albus TaxID=3110766 RepID=UPI00300C385E